jgi:hypothetical protein
MNGMPVLEMKKMRALAEDAGLVVVFQPEARFERRERGFFLAGKFGRSHALIRLLFTDRASN